MIENHSIYNDTMVEYKFDTGPIKHDVIAGFEVGHDSYSNQAYTRNNLPVVPMLDPPIMGTPSNVTTTVGNYADSGSNELAAYANDTISLNQQWKIIGGLRWDRFQAQIHNTISLPVYATQTNYFTSVRAGVIYQPTDWQSYYVSYGTSFDPSLEALTLTNLTQNLAPESTKSYEVGGKWDLLGGNLSVTSAFFREEMNNARTQVSPTEYELAGDIRVDGFQAGVTGHITDKWQVFGGYTYMDAIILKALDGTQGTLPANTPRNTLTLWTHLRDHAALGNWRRPDLHVAALRVEHELRASAGLHALGCDRRVSREEVRRAPEPAEHDQQGVLRRADSVGRRPFGAGYRTHVAGDVRLPLLIHAERIR